MSLPNIASSTTAPSVTTSSREPVPDSSPEKNNLKEKEKASSSASSPVSEPGGKKKTTPPPNPRASGIPKIQQRSSSFRMTPQPAPKSPRAKKLVSSPTSPRAEKPVHENSSTATSTGTGLEGYESSSQRSGKRQLKEIQNAQPAPTRADPAEASSLPVLKIVKLQIPKGRLAMLERDHIDQQLARLLVDDLYEDRYVPAHLHTVGRADSAFYIDKLPEVLKPFAIGMDQATVPSAKLMRKPFAEEFRRNTAWATAKTLYANFIFSESAQAISLASDAQSPEMQTAKMEKYKAHAEVMARTLLGYPPSLKHSPLPGRVLDFLVRCDQLFHEKLIKGKHTQAYTTAQMRDARLALLKQLLVTRMLQPMLVQLAGRFPTDNEVRFLGSIMQSLLSSVPVLANELFVKSFAQWPEPLQKLATEKLRREKIEERKKTMKSKPSVRHHRARSADTTPVDIRSLPTREEALRKRAQQNVLASASQLEQETSRFDQAISDARKTVDDKVEFEQGLASVKELKPEELDQLLKMIQERDDDDLAEMVASGTPVPGRARPLSFDSSEEERSSPLPDQKVMVATTGNTVSTVTTSTITDNGSAQDSSDDDRSHQDL